MTETSNEKNIGCRQACPRTSSSLIIVKELIALKRCQSTYLRQATMTPNLTRDSLMSVNPEDLSRFNRTFQVYKPIRGTSSYYEETAGKTSTLHI